MFYRLRYCRINDLDIKVRFKIGKMIRLGTVAVKMFSNIILNCVLKNSQEFQKCLKDSLIFLDSQL